MRRERASTTAMVVGQLVLHASRRADLARLVPGEWVEALTHVFSGSDETRRRLRNLDRWWWPAYVGVAERLEPGFTAHCVLRKRYFEQQVRAALDAGAEQVINVGAGFDTLLWRLHQAHPERRFFEIDHPATQAVKAQGFAHAGVGENLRWQPVDLTEATLADALRATPGFTPGARTAWLCEGVLMYVSTEDARRTFATFAEASGPGSRVLFTFMPGLGHFGWMARLALWLRGEGLRWAPTPEALAPFLAEAGWGLDEALPTAMLRDALAPALPGVAYASEQVAGATLK